MKTKSREELITELVQLHARQTMLEQLVRRGEKHSQITGTTTDIGTFVIEEGHALFQAVVEGFDGVIYVSDADYRLAYLNSQCRHQAGGDAVGEICYKALYQLSKPCCFCVKDQVQRGQTVRFEIVNPKDGRWYLSINCPIRHSDGRISMLAMVSDINDCKQAQSILKSAEIQTQSRKHDSHNHNVPRCKFGNLVGKSPAMQEVYEKIASAAATDATVIIYGEPGTGKELVAQAIHAMSRRAENHFVPVHCGAIPENLIESEFFGYKKGAFSGADSDRNGYFDFADGGTMFLDEIGEISLHMQIKLLRVIEGVGFTPVGSSQVKPSDTRIIAATNRDLRERIAKGRMREDFYYRIHILPIHLPSLRERKEDLPLLIDHFLKLYSGNQPPPPLTQKVLSKLANYDWPGNIRELQNVIIRYCSLQVIELETAPQKKHGFNNVTLPNTGTAPEKDLKTMMAAHERNLIVQTLERQQWHRGRAAEQLGVDRKTLFSKMKRYGLG